MSFNVKKKVCIILIGILILLTIIPLVFLKKTQPEGEYITQEEMVVLVELLDTVLQNRVANSSDFSETIQQQIDVISFLEDTVSHWKVDEYVTYEQFRQWEDVADEAFEVWDGEEEKRLSKTYRNSSYITKKDWFSYFEKLCNIIDQEGNIITEALLVLGDASNVVDVAGNPIEKNYVLTQNGRWEKKLDTKYIPLQQTAFYITYRGALWGVYYVEPAAALFNAWIVENTEEEFVYFYKNYKVTTTKSEGFESLEREQVADIQFALGKLSYLVLKTEKITGKVLKMSSDEVEIAGIGTIPLSENIQYYRLYDRLENVGRSEIPLGYDFTDFVVEEGEIQAALLVKDEKMENIRVLIKNSNFDSYYHKEIVMEADVDLEMICGNDKIEIAAGERLCIYPESEYFTTNRIYVRPKALTGRTVFHNIERNNGGQGYYGSFELEKQEDGIVLINEVLLEEYLYAVVPSEMPGYYPLEALKAQAISARTYAYHKMIHSGLSSYGANVDDSSTYQVYNNIKENVNTTTAVKETRGQLLYAENGLAETYYYSTSCGFGTNGAIWNTNSINTLPYLQAKEMTVETASYTAEKLQTEEGFHEFISKANSSHFESKEGWYRWKYSHRNLITIAEKLKNRLEKYPNYVFTSTDGITWGKQPLEEGFTITDIQVRKRGVGGTIEELLISTDKGYFLIKNEYHIRAVLADGEAKVILQNGDNYACGNLLPSAFFVVDVEKEENKVMAVNLTGGGFGHGVGMSQNGAKNLANTGFNAKDILEFYYEGCEVRQ